MTYNDVRTNLRLSAYSVLHTEMCDRYKVKQIDVHEFPSQQSGKHTILGILMSTFLTSFYIQRKADTRITMVFGVLSDKAV